MPTSRPFARTILSTLLLAALSLPAFAAEPA